MTWVRSRDADSSRGAASLSTQRADSTSTGTPHTGYGTVTRGHSSAYDSGGGQQESPLVRRGLIVNERTGKTIKIGAGTYNKLLLEVRTNDVDVCFKRALSRKYDFQKRHGLLWTASVPGDFHEVMWGVFN
jgi:hypothetical protein